MTVTQIANISPDETGLESTPLLLLLSLLLQEKKVWFIMLQATEKNMNMQILVTAKYESLLLECRADGIWYQVTMLMCNKQLISEIAFFVNCYRIPD